MKTATSNSPALPASLCGGWGAEVRWGPDHKTAGGLDPALAAESCSDRVAPEELGQGIVSEIRLYPALANQACNGSIGLYRRLASAEVGPVWGQKVLLWRLGEAKSPAFIPILTLTGVPLG
jgi:hypothetical protein